MGMAEHAKLELDESTESYNVPKVIILSSETTTTLGRSSKMCTVLLDATPTKSISRKHAEIVCRKGKRRRNDTYILRDLDSTNGVFVNDVKIREQELEHGDVLQFGGAADIPVGTRFGGTGSHIRYRFHFKPAPPAAPDAPLEKRRRPDPTPGEPAAQRVKVALTNTLDAAETLRAISSGRAGGSSKPVDAGLELGRSGAGNGGRTESEAGGGGAGGGGGGGVVDEDGDRGGGGGGFGGESWRGSAVGCMQQENKGGDTPGAVAEVLREAICGLCSELLLDAGVLPCSHSFCRLCWANHVEEKGTTCPVCLRKMHSSERNPRQCARLDLIIESIVNKLAGPREQERWKARQARAQEREAAAAATAAAGRGNQNVGTGSGARRAAAPSPIAAKGPHPSPGRGVQIAQNGINRQMGCAASRRRSKGAVGGGEATGAGSMKAAAAAAANLAEAEAAVKAATCQGCNEKGHQFLECPYRSDSALEGSGDDQDDDEESENSKAPDEDEDEDEDEDDEDGDDDDFHSDDA